MLVDLSHLAPLRLWKILDQGSHTFHNTPIQASTTLFRKEFAYRADAFCHQNFIQEDMKIGAQKATHRIPQFGNNRGIPELKDPFMFMWSLGSIYSRLQKLGNTNVARLLFPFSLVLGLEDVHVLASNYCVSNIWTSSLGKEGLPRPIGTATDHWGPIRDYSAILFLIGVAGSFG